MTKYCKSIKANTAFCSDKTKMKKKFLNCFKLSKKSALVIVCLAGMIFIGSYIFQINYVSTKGFELRELEDKVVQLQKENKKYELQLIELQSMRYLSNKATELNLVQTNDIRYIDISGTTFAQR